MEGPVRKQNRLKDYDYAQNGVYFVTICTKDKQKILCDIVGGGALDAPQIKLSTIGKIVDKYIQSTNNIPEIAVHKYVIMPNHIHLLLSVCMENGTSRVSLRLGPLAVLTVHRTVIHCRSCRFATPSPTTTQRVSRANQLVPHAISTLKRFVNRDVGYNVFQRSFHDHVVRGEQDYREIWQYIDENPQKWQEDCFFVTEDIPKTP